MRVGRYSKYFLRKYYLDGSGDLPFPKNEHSVLTEHVVAIKSFVALRGRMKLLIAPESSVAGTLPPCVLNS